MEPTVLDNLKAAQDEFKEWLESKEEILSFIDVKSSMKSKLTNSAPFESIVTYSEEKSVHVFLYETENHLYMLNCNVKGIKVKHEVLDYAGLELVIMASPSGYAFTLIANNGWFYKGSICNEATEQLRKVAEKRNVKVKEKTEGDTKAFLRKNTVVGYEITVLVFFAIIVGLSIIAFYMTN